MGKKNNSKYFYNNNYYKKNYYDKKNKSNKKKDGYKKMSKSKKGHNPSGSSISADMSQFQGTSLEKLAKLFKKFIPTKNEFHAFKHHAKEIMAQRLRYSVKKLGMLRPISSKSKKILFDYLENKFGTTIAKNVNCIVKAYNDFKVYELKDPKYKGNEKDKVLQHLNKDYNKALDKYICPAKKYAESKAAGRPEVNDIVQQYQFLLDSLKFFYDFILKYITGYIPNSINKELVEYALNEYKINLTEYYDYDNNTNVYVAKSIIPLSDIKEDYVTYIICYCR